MNKRSFFWGAPNPFKKGCMFFYPLDEPSGNAIDALGGAVAVNTGGITRTNVDAKAAYSAVFSEGKYFISPPSSIYKNEGDFTISAFLKLGEGLFNQSILACVDTASCLENPTILSNQGNGFGNFFWLNSNQIGYGLEFGDEGKIQSRLLFNSFDFNVWTHWVITHVRSEKTLRFYKNNVYAGKHTYYYLPNHSGSNYKVVIGASGILGGGMDGKANYLGWWKRVLPAEERTQLFNNGLGFNPFA